MSAMRADVTIIGGGLTGCAAAYYLRRRGRSVVVLERGLVGGQSSGVNFGNLRLQGRYPGQIPLALRAQALWEEMERTLGETLEFSQTGHAYIALNAEQLPQLERISRDARPYGLITEILDRREVTRRWPFLSEQVQGASWSSRCATVNPRLVCPALARAGRRIGAEILEQVSVTGIEHNAGAFRIATDRGITVESAALINAAGAWGARLAAQFGETAPLFAAGPPQMVTEPVPRFCQPVFQAVYGGIIFRQTARGNLVVAGHPRMAVDAENARARVPPTKITTNMARLAAVVPLLRGRSVIRSWSGIEGYFPDMLPVLGPSETTPGLFHAFGFCGHGLQIGPAVGSVLAELVVDGASPTPIGDFAIGRFRNAAPPDPERLKHEFSAEILRANIAA